MNKKYRKMIEQIGIDNEKYSDEQMKEVYKAQKDELDTLHALLGTMFITYGVIGLLKMTSQQKADIGIKTLLKNMGKKLGDAEVEKVTSIIGDIYKDTYYKTAFIMDSGMKLDLKFNMLKKEYIDAAVNTEFKGEMFSDRIWKNKADMIDKLQAGLTDAMNGKTTIDKVARDIKETFNTTAYESQRLVNTENARAQTQASYDIGISAGVEQVLWSATLDMLTCPEDAELDGKIFPIDEAPECPAHPNCRCEIINIPHGNWIPTERMDNETKDIIDYVDYETWLKDRNV